MNYWTFGRFVIVRELRGWAIKSIGNDEEEILCGTVAEALAHLSSFIEFEKA